MAMLWLVCHGHTFFFYPVKINACYEIQKEITVYAHLAKSSFFAGKMSEYLIHIQHIQASDGELCYF